MKPQKLFMLRNNLLLLLWVFDDMRQLAANISRSIFLAAYQKGGKTPEWGAEGVRQGRQGGTKCTHTAYINQFQLTLIKYTSSGHDHSNRQQQQQQSSGEERDRQRGRQRDGEKKDAARVWSEIKRMDSQLGLHQVLRGEGDLEGEGVRVELGQKLMWINEICSRSRNQRRNRNWSSWKVCYTNWKYLRGNQNMCNCHCQGRSSSSSSSSFNSSSLFLPLLLSLSLVFSVCACVAVRVPVFCGYALGLTAMRPKPNKQAKRQQHQQQQQNEPESVAQWQIAGAAQVKPQWCAQDEQTSNIT